MSAPAYQVPTYENSVGMPLERDIEKNDHHQDGIKKDVNVETVRFVPEDDVVKNEADYARDPHKHHHLNWNPGFVRRFPWMGFGALCGVFVCMGVAILVLLLSHDKSQSSKSGDRWPKWIAPSVILSGLNSISSLCFSLAIANGVAIAWWRQTLKGATIKELHKSWSFATSMKEVLLAGRKFNFIALAALTMKLTIIDGVLMQSSTKTVYADDNARIGILSVGLHQQIPVTGWVSPGDNGPGFITDALSEKVKGWKSSIIAPELDESILEGCDGICFANVVGAGFEFDCDEPRTTSINWGRDLVNSTVGRNNTALKVFVDALDHESDSTMFKIAFQAIYNNGDASVPSSYINMTMVHTKTGSQADLSDPSESCVGRRVTQTCRLWPANINYPIMVNNQGYEDLDGNGKVDEKKTGQQSPQTIRVGAVEGWWMDFTPPENYMDMYSLYNAEMGQQAGFTVLNRTPILEDHRDLFPDAGQVDSRLAGLEVALNAVFGGEANLNKQQSGYTLQQNGTAFSWSVATPAWDDCSYSFYDPTTNSNNGPRTPNSIFASINSLMFLVAADAAAGVTKFSAMTDPPAGYGITQHNATIYAKSVHYRTNWHYMLGACLSTLVCGLCVIPVYWGYWQLGRDVSLGPFEIAHAFQSPLTSEASQGSIRELLQEVGKREVRYGQYTTDDGRTVFVVADPDQLSNLDRDTKAEFRQQMSHVFSRERSQRTLQTLKTFGVKVEEKRDSM